MLSHRPRVRTHNTGANDSAEPLNTTRSRSRTPGAKGGVSPTSSHHLFSREPRGHRRYSHTLFHVANERGPHGISVSRGDQNVDAPGPTAQIELRSQHHQSWRSSQL